ncbi:MAG: HAMP domain-containing protein [Chloroflexi bacterium]|nr:HAMP domain-containing protein [Chloroflexota bacterium]
MVWNSLAFKLTVASVAIALVAVGTAAILINRATTRDFDRYLTHDQTMERMMSGGMMGGPTAQVRGVAEEQFLQRNRRALWTGGLVGSGVAILLGLALAGQIRGPLAKFSKASRQVAKGDFSQRVEGVSGGELGELATAFNLMTENLQQDEQRRQRLLADIAHELRTPLSVIQGNLEAMLDGVLEPDAAHLEALHRESGLLARIVRDLRDLTLAEAGQLRLERVPTDVEPLVAQEVARVEAEARDRGIALRSDLPVELPALDVDPDRARQVLGNLLSNALRYTPSGGSITIGARDDISDGLLTLYVADTGSGIAPGDLPHIFDHFYRADPSRQRASGGSGIGLAIVKQLVEAHGGRVWVESQLGKGSTFFISLPPVAGAEAESEDARRRLHSRAS